MDPALFLSVSMYGYKGEFVMSHRALFLTGSRVFGYLEDGAPSRRGVGDYKIGRASCRERV